MRHGWVDRNDAIYRPSAKGGVVRTRRLILTYWSSIPGVIRWSYCYDVETAPHLGW